jgi:hypothetical protein
MTSIQISQEIEKNKLTLNSHFSFESLTDGGHEIRKIEKCDIIDGASEQEQDGNEDEFHPTEAWIHAFKNDVKSGEIIEYFITFKNFLLQRESVIEVGALLGALRERYKVSFNKYTREIDFQSALIEIMAKCYPLVPKETIDILEHPSVMQTAP